MIGMGQLYRCCRDGYVAALAMDAAWRAKNQSLLCQLREAIAAYEQRTAREVQEEYEEVALMERTWNR